MSKSRVGAPPGAGENAIDASALAWQPATLAAFNQLYGTLWSRGLLDHSSKEIARLRNARTTGCAFCKSVRFQGAVDEGLNEDRVALIQDGFEDSELSHRDKLVVCYTDCFLTDPGSIGSDLKAEMAAEFSEPEIVELTAALALFMGFSKIAISLGGMPDQFPLMQMPTPE